jgi:hypothetical protein
MDAGGTQLDPGLEFTGEALEKLARMVYHLDAVETDAGAAEDPP